MKKGTVITVLVVAGLLALSSHGKQQTASLPDLRGEVLEAAQDTARQAGFTTLASHDARGERRMQFLGQNWKVCGQSPAPGRHSTTTRIDFAVVKRSERCP
ncbi:hypothetical protein [Streptomyces sp. CS131]|uniref:PASTA domain-containing protein n=1 Tax=Streptomyces sp. CS131 TaxID=2162711 RepID=UPI000D50BA02|nr:hypothetical protein [Streptomyces sp. CS131]PVC90112.1 hypothetical protein DBP20_03170 [Streptomyces sp. CS131]